MIGNGVSIPVGEWIGKEITRITNDNRSTKSCEQETTSSRYSKALTFVKILKERGGNKDEAREKTMRDNEEDDIQVNS